MSAAERIEAERDGSRSQIHNPELSMYQQDMAAMRAWAFDVALMILRDEQMTNVAKDVGYDSQTSY